MDARPHVLCVDDEPKVLEGLRLSLHRHFRVTMSRNGQAGLAVVEGPDPPAVVVSDMRMPEMDGGAFLNRVRERSPDTVRVLLTGQAALDSAIAAVNHGQVFRFLTKPCKTETLLDAVTAAVQQHRLLTAERVLLEQTLRGSIKALTDILALANPLAFGHALRLKQSCADVLAGLELPASWQLEVAAMLSQIGAITLPAETQDRLYRGHALAASEARLVGQLPALAEQILDGIPRLEAVRAILHHQPLRFDGVAGPPGAPTGEGIPLGARVLKIVGDYLALEGAGHDPESALRDLRARQGMYDPTLLDAFARSKAALAPRGRQQLALGALSPGMLLDAGLVSISGVLLASRGQEVTVGLLQRLRHLPAGSVPEPIAVLVSEGPESPMTEPGQGASSCR